MKAFSKIFACILLASCQGGQFKSGAASDSTPSSTPPAVTEDAAPKTPDTTVENTVVTPPPPVDDGNIFKECNGNPNLPFIADLYQLPVQTKLLPDFSTLKAIKQICILQLNIANRDFNTGFPGVEALFEWFGLSIQTKLLIPKDGDYTFLINSDDGSKVYIQNELLITNDGQHSQKELSAVKTLKAGTYDLRVEYFQGPRFNIALELFWMEPGATTKTYIPAQYLKRP